jgi:hypothetical protein
LPVFVPWAVQLVLGAAQLASQAPATHDCPASQPELQLPHFSALAEISVSQVAAAPASTQVAKPGRQVQTPALQSWLAEQAMLQPPQLFGSALVSTQLAPQVV